MIRSGCLPLCLVVCLGLAFGEAALAADAGATFESFYRQGSGADWGMAGLGGAAANILVLVGLPAITTPALSAMGSSLGALFGLPGAAATGFGLILLGATAGGFGTEGGSDPGGAHLPATYEASRFVEASATMMSLPLPAIAGKAESVKAAARMFESSVVADGGICVRKHAAIPDEFRTCIAAQQKSQRQMMRSALSVMRPYAPAVEPLAAERESALLALLYFANNDHPAARQAAARAYELGLKAGTAPTLPAFVSAIGMLYDERPNIAESFARFRYSITAEPNNPWSPVLFAAYLDRLSYRMNDRAAVVADLDRLVALSASLADDERKLAIQQILLAHYLAQIKAAQQRVMALTGAQSRAVRADPKTLDAAKAFAGEYAAMVTTGNALVDRQAKLPPTAAREAFLQPVRQALANYQRDQAGLSQRVASLEREIAAARPPESLPAKTEPPARLESQATPEQQAKPEPQASPEPQPAGESGFSSIFNRVKGLFK